MSDLWAVVLAACVCAGAVAGADGHLPAVSLACALAVLAAGWGVARLRRRHVEVLCLGAALLAAALAQRSIAGLEAPLATGAVHAEVTLVGDPVPDGRGGVRVDVRHDGRRLRGVARAAAAAALDDRLAGERVTVLGTVRPPGPTERWLRYRHLAGRLEIETVTGWRVGDPASRLANGLRRTLARGAAGLPERHRSLLAGVTLGDDRAQPADMTDAFRAAGLTHLLAVSGQNVAFVLVIAAPLLTRLRFGPRLVATLAVLGLFALVTRAEPSVMRATAMASVAAVGAALGRPTTTVRTLSLGVAAMVLVDPLLATSLGFRLSVAGTAGLVAGADRLVSVVPGPRWFATPLAMTVSAQAAVSPLLVAAFGSVPLASLPANMLAAPVAGPLMVWGLTGGLVAGVVGEPAAGILHLPTRPLLAWLDGVATRAAGWPLGDLRAGHLAVVAAGALVAASGAVVARVRGHPVDDPAGGRAGRRTAGGEPGGTRPGRRGPGPRVVARWAGSAVVVATLAGAATDAGAGSRPLDDEPLGVGAAVWHRDGVAVVVVDGRARDAAVLSGLRRARVRRVDVLVARTGAHATGDVADTLRRRWPHLAVVAPPADRPMPGAAGPQAPAIAGAVVPPPGTVVDVGTLRLAFGSVRAGRLDVEVTPTTATAASRGPGARPRAPVRHHLARPRPPPVPVGHIRRPWAANRCPPPPDAGASPSPPRPRPPPVPVRARPTVAEAVPAPVVLACVRPARPAAPYPRPA